MNKKKTNLLTGLLGVASIFTSFNSQAQNSDRIEDAQHNISELTQGVIPLVYKLEGKELAEQDAAHRVLDFSYEQYNDDNLKALQKNAEVSQSNNQNIINKLNSNPAWATAEIDVKKAKQISDSLNDKKVEIKSQFGITTPIINRNSTVKEAQETVNKAILANNGVEYDKEALNKALGNIDEQINYADRFFNFCTSIGKAEKSKGELLSSFDKYIKNKVDSVGKESDRQAMDIVLGSFEKDFREKGFGDIADIVSKNRKYLKIRNLDNSVAKALNDIKKVSGSDPYGDLLKRQNNLLKHLEDMEKGWGIK